jgi:hypothetical protein
MEISKAYAFFISPMRASFAANLILHDLITVIMFVEK